MYLRTRWHWAAATGLTLLAACEIAPHSTGPTSGAVVQIVVRPDSVALDPQQTQPFRAFGRTATGDSVPATVRWSTSGGTITSSGMYTADTSASDVVVTASLSTAQLNGTANVKKKRLVQIVVSPASAVLAEGGVQQFTAYGRKNTGDSVSVNVGYTATGGAITQSGSYTAGQAMGNFQVMVKQNGGALTDSSAVTVIAVPVASVAVSPASASVGVGQTVQLAATLKDASGNPLSGRVVTWVSGNTAVATVSSGLVTAVAPGAVTITATSEGHSGTATATVTALPPPPVASVAVSPATAGVQVGASVQLVATPKDASGNPLSGRVVTWVSGNTAVATVSSGLVTGVAAGTVTITATSEGQSGTATITVTALPPPPVASVAVTPATASVPVGQTMQLAATTKDLAGNVLAGRIITWGTSNAGVAAASATGLVTGVTAGSATVTATSEGRSGTSAITVSVPPPPSSCAATGSGVCRYVDGAAGNDANPGTSAQPFRTLSQAASVVNPGDVVIVRNGVYTAPSGVYAILGIGRGGTASDLVVFKAENRWGAVLDGQSNTTEAGVSFGANYARVEGFEIRGVWHYGVDMGVGLTGDQVAGNNIHDVGRFCTGTTQGLSGIGLASGDALIEQNIIHDLGRFGPGENGCTPPNAYWQNHDHGIYHQSGNNVTIRNNIFYNLVHGWAIQRYSTAGDAVDNARIVNNTFAFPNPNRQGQIVVGGTMSNSVITNNIFYQPLTAGIWFDAGTMTNVTVANNMTSNGPVNYGTLPGVTFSNNFDNTNPLLVNPAGFDFHLTAGSPAIGAGLSLPYVPNDFAGVSRPAGAAYDIGAYQFR
jgi:uncharacterized protein YjdB